MKNVAVYDAWYQSARGSWIGQQEFFSIMKLFTPKAGQSLLDVGCGTGYFSENFRQLDLQVTGLDPNVDMIDFAQSKYSKIKYIEGNALSLPFDENSFDYCAAITSLCFIPEAVKAIKEMLRVSRGGIILGLLNRHSFLYQQKKHSTSYQGARWDTTSEIKQWCRTINPELDVVIKSAILMPTAGIIARTVEWVLPDYFPYASFLAVSIKYKTNG